MKIRYLGTAAAEGWPALFCSCPICTHARIQGGKNLRTRTQAILDGELLIDFPPDTYCHALQYGLELAKNPHSAGDPQPYGSLVSHRFNSPP